MVHIEVLEILGLSILKLQPPVQPIVVVEVPVVLPLRLVGLNAKELDPVITLVDERLTLELSFNSCSQENIPVAFHRLHRCLVYSHVILQLGLLALMLSMLVLLLGRLELLQGM